MPTLAATVLDFVDGDHTLISFIGSPTFRQPFAGDNGYYILEQKCRQFLADFNATALNTAYPLAPYSSYILVSEGPLQDVGGGLVDWVQTYALVPNTRNDPSSISYNFIGYYGTVANLAVALTLKAVGRPRNTFVVKCRIQNDYYFCATGQTYTTFSQIPIILAQRYYVSQGTISGSTWTPTYTLGSAADLATASDQNDLWNIADWGGLIPTRPTQAAYAAMILAGTEIVAENSTISRWQGNIFQRQTKFIVAQ
jgi:hypothetical protein